jgi:hypothetical protein
MIFLVGADNLSPVYWTLTVDWPGDIAKFHMDIANGRN